MTDLLPASTMTNVFSRPGALMGILLVFILGMTLIVMRKKVLSAVSSAVIARPWYFIAGGVLLTICSVITIPFMHISTSRSELLDKDNPFQRQQDAFLEEFGTPNHLIAVVEGGDEESRRKAADELARILEKEEKHFRFVQYRIDIDSIKKQGLLYLPLKELERLRSLMVNPEDPESKKRVQKFLQIRGLEELFKTIDSVFVEAMEDPDALPETEGVQDFATGLNIIEQMFDEMADWVKDGDRDKITVMENLFLKEFDLSQANLDDKGYLADRDKNRLFLFIRPNTDSDETRELVPIVRKARKAAEGISQKFGVNIGFTGTPAMIVDEMDTISRDLLFMTVLALVGTVLLFLAVFRSGRLMALALVTLCTGLLWSLGFTIIAYSTINLLTSLFFAILIGLGIDFSIHIIARFNEERGLGNEPLDAVRKAIMGVGPGLLTGALTTASAFYATAITEFTAFSELGIIAGTGLLLVLVASLTILPSLLVLAPGPVPSLLRAGTGKKRSKLTQLVVRWPAAVLLTAILVTAPVIVRPKPIPFDYNITQMLPARTESREYYTKMVSESDFASEFVNIVAGGLVDTRELTERLKKLETVGRVESIAEMIPEQQDEKLAVLKTLKPIFEGADTRYDDLPAVDFDRLDMALESIHDNLDDALEKAVRVKRPEAPHLKKLMEILDRTRRELKSVDKEAASARLTAFQNELFSEISKGISTLKEMLDPEPVTVESLPESVKDRFVSRRGEDRFAVYVYPKRSIWDRAFLGEFVKDARQIAPEATGFPVNYYEHVRMIQSGFIEAAFLAGLAILMMLLVDFSRKRYVVLGIVPLGLLAFWSYTVFGLWGGVVLVGLGLGGMLLLDAKSVVYCFLAFVPLSMGAAWMLGMMGVLKINYNLANIVSLPLLLGIGIVYSVHIIHRHREEHYADIYKVVRTTGGAVTLAALTTMVGFGALITAAHGGARSVGLTMVIGVATCMVSAVVVLPALLKVFPWRVFETGTGGDSDGGGSHAHAVEDPESGDSVADPENPK